MGAQGGEERGRAAARELLADLPELHRWTDGAPCVGGLNARLGERMLEELDRYDAPRIVETGAGATTLLFCCLDPRALTSIAPDAGLGRRIVAEAGQRGIDSGVVRYLCERSEVALPRLAAEGDVYEVGLIDGAHGWPSVFVDFCYINAMMPAGGTVFVDDVQLYSVSQLCLLLRQQDEFEYVALDGKMATFRKLVDSRFLPEWNFQPFIVQSGLGQPPGA